jgi:tRNA U34 5-carboxymethylaminomethyl modifying enzyme MnmG/GidA
VYSGYIEKEEIMQINNSFRRCKDSTDFDYDKIKSMSIEAKQS